MKSISTRKIAIYFLLLSAALGALFVFLNFYSNKKQDPQEKLCGELIEFFITPSNYDMLYTIEGTEEFNRILKEDFRCVSLPNSSDLSIGAYLRYYGSVIEEKNITKVEIKSLDVMPSKMPKYRSYTPEKTFVCDIDYDYIGEKEQFNITDRYYIGFFEGNIVYFKADNDILISTGIMSLMQMNR